jgi:hypothetical protein
MPRTISKWGAAVIAAGLLAACGGVSGGGPGSGAAGIRHPLGADRLVLRVDTEGGFVAPNVLTTKLPDFSLFGDGTVVIPGPMIEIYPGPALPNVLSRRLSEPAVQRVLREAATAGLLGPDRSFTTMPVSDMPTTVFTLVANGRRHVISVFGLGASTPSPDMPSAEREARSALLRLQSKLFDLSSWLPAGDVSAERPYAPSALRLLVRPYRSVADPNLTEPAARWPLAERLASFGRPSPDLVGARCGTVRGDDAKRLVALAERANQLTPWLSRGRSFGIAFRPLLPDESG